MNNTSINKINNYFLNLREQSVLLAELFEHFNNNKIEFGFLGGSVRNAISGENALPRDLDIIFDGNDADFDSFLTNLSVEFKKNSFGGRKIQKDNMVFDIWSLSKHHLILEDIYSKTFNNVPKTTFVNYDSIFFNWTKQQLFDNYSKCAQDKIIDFVGNKKSQEANSQLEVTICKLALLKDSGYEFSERLDSFISDYMQRNFTDVSLFTQKEWFDSFIFKFKKHYNGMIDSVIENKIYSFIRSYL